MFSRVTLKSIVISICLLIACPAVKSAPDPFRQNRRLGRGINLGNALEAPREGQWGVRLKEEYFKAIADAGFDSVRIPVRFSAHAQAEAPYTIDAAFFERVDWAIKNALANDLYVIVNIHHYGEIHENPQEHKARFLGLWKQIGERYKDYPNSLLLELLNEPNKNLKADLWNEYLAEALAVVRKSNPDRTIVIGPPDWNNINGLAKLKLPEDDRNIIVTCHYYNPFQFTHQGAGWVGGKSNEWLGTEWTGSMEEKKKLAGDLDKAFNWGKEHKRPINIGEFGAYSKADMESRARWTAFVTRQAEKRRFSWHYWEFCSGFGAYDPGNDQWREPLLKALIPSKK